MAKKNRRTVRRLPISKIRSEINDVVKRVNRNREYVVLEKHGEPVAGVIGLEDLEDILELQDEKLNAQIAKGWAEFKRGEIKKTGQEFLDELRAELRVEKRKRKAA